RQLPSVLPFLTAASEARLARAFQDAQKVLGNPKLDPGQAWYEARNLLSQALQRENATLRSAVELAGGPAGAEAEGARALAAQAGLFRESLDGLAKSRGAKGTTPSASWRDNADASRVPVRTGDFGPLTYQNDNVLLARLGTERY